MGFQEGVHVDGFAVRHGAGVAVAEETSVVDAGRNDVGLAFLRAGESHAGDAFADGQAQATVLRPAHN